MADKKQQYGVLEGTLVYAKIAESAKKYESNDEEYVISVIVNEDVADEWDGKFAKQASKKVKASDFESKYKIPLPEQLKGEKNVYEIKVKKDAIKDGVPFYPEHRPRVFVDFDNGDRVDITESRLIANGSYGKVSYRVTENKFGTFAKLGNVLMDEAGFKEYVQSGGGAAGNEFGSKAVKKEEAKESATKARAIKAKQEDKQPEPKYDDLDDQIPF